MAHKPVILDQKIITLISDTYLLSATSYVNYDTNTVIFIAQNTLTHCFTDRDSHVGAEEELHICIQ